MSYADYLKHSQIAGGVVAQKNPVTGGIDISSGGASLMPYMGKSTVPLRKFQAALARVRSGTGNATIACVGDSTTAGVRSNGTTDWTGNKAISYPSMLAAELTAAGVATCLGSVTGDNGTLGHAGTIPSYDPRVVSGASYTLGSLGTAGGAVIYNAAGSLGSASAETFTFTPTDSFDTVDVYWYRSGTVGTFTIDCGGAVLATCAAGASGIVKTTVSKTAGAGVVNLIRTVVGQIIICGINTYLSTKKTVNVLNMGISGASTTDWNSAAGPYNPLPMLATYAPDLTIINLGINNAKLGKTTTYADMVAIINAAKATGDVVVVIPNNTASAWTSDASQATVRADLIKAAQDCGVAMFDLQGRWLNYTTANALGYMASDTIHPVKLGYQDAASSLARFVLEN